MYRYINLEFDIRRQKDNAGIPLNGPDALIGKKWAKHSQPLDKTDIDVLVGLQ